MLTEFQRMQLIGDEFPLPLVAPLVIAKVDAVALAVERAVLAERTGLGEVAARDQLQRTNLAAMADDIDKLRAALTELLACHTEAAGWTASMLADRSELDAMLAKSQKRLGAAVLAARLALGA